MASEEPCRNAASPLAARCELTPPLALGSARRRRPGVPHADDVHDRLVQLFEGDPTRTPTSATTTNARPDPATPTPRRHRPEEGSRASPGARIPTGLSKDSETTPSCGKGIRKRSSSSNVADPRASIVRCSHAADALRARDHDDVRDRHRPRSEAFPVQATPAHHPLQRWIRVNGQRSGDTIEDEPSRKVPAWRLRCRIRCCSSSPS